MSIKDRLANKSATIGSTPRAAAEGASPGKPKTGAGQLMQSLPMLAEKDSEIASLREELQASRENAAASEISLSELNEVPGRRRKLTPEQFAELRENLRNNSLVSAITVRTRRDGGYEIISGHNRVAAFKELGKEKILAVVINANDAESELGAFYANLLQTGLPDYEKYLGFKRRQMATGKNQLQLATEAGVTASFVSMLMAFENLPTEIISMLDDRPDLVGANAAEDFVNLAQKGRTPQVIEAVKAIALEGMSQAAALRMAAKDAALPAPKAAARKIRSGKAVFAEIRVTDKTIRISFRSEDERTMVEEAIGEVLKRYAEQVKPK